MPFSIIRNDITKMEVDAIVHTTNVYLKQGSGTSRAIFLAAGEEMLTEACEKLGRLLRRSQPIFLQSSKKEMMDFQRHCLN